MIRTLFPILLITILLTACSPAATATLTELPTAVPSATVTPAPTSTVTPTLEPWMQSLPENVISIEIDGDHVFGLDAEKSRIMQFDIERAVWMEVIDGVATGEDGRNFVYDDEAKNWEELAALPDIKVIEGESSVDTRRVMTTEYGNTVAINENNQVIYKLRDGSWVGVENIALSNYGYFERQDKVKKQVEESWGCAFEECMKKEFPGEVKSIDRLNDGRITWESTMEMVVVGEPEVVPVTRQIWLDRGYVEALTVYFGMQDYPNPFPYRIGFFNEVGEYIPDVQSIDGFSANINDDIILSSPDVVNEEFTEGRHLWVKMISYLRSDDVTEDDWSANTPSEGNNYVNRFFKELRTEEEWRIFVDSALDLEGLPRKVKSVQGVSEEYIVVGGRKPHRFARALEIILANGEEIDPWLLWGGLVLIQSYLFIRFLYGMVVV